MNVLIGYKMNYIDNHMETIHPYLFPQKKVVLNCENLALFIRELNSGLLFCHIISTAALLFREIRENTVG